MHGQAFCCKINSRTAKTNTIRYTPTHMVVSEVVWDCFSFSESISKVCSEARNLKNSKNCFLLEATLGSLLTCNFTRSRKILNQRSEFMVVPSVVEKLNLPNELDFYPVMFEFLARFLQIDNNFSGNTFTVKIQQELLLPVLIHSDLCTLSGICAVQLKIYFCRLTET